MAAMICGRRRSFGYVFQFLVNCKIVSMGIAVFDRHVEDMDDDARPFDVFQNLKPGGSLARPLDQTGKVGSNKLLPSFACTTPRLGTRVVKR